MQHCASIFSLYVFVRTNWLCMGREEKVDKCVSPDEIIPATPANSRHAALSSLTIRSTPLPRLCSLQFYLRPLMIVIRPYGCWRISSWEDDDACQDLLMQAGKRPILLALIRRLSTCGLTNAACSWKAARDGLQRHVLLRYVACMTICNWARS